MYTLLVVIHVLICILMVGAILLQSGKGAEIGASFGGSSQTVFGSRGPANFLSKFTVVVAAVFMMTSLGLAILAKEQAFSSTVIDLKKKELKFAVRYDYLIINGRLEDAIDALRSIIVAERCRRRRSPGGQPFAGIS